MDPTMDTPTVEAVEPSVDMFGIEPPPQNIFGAVDQEVLMYYLEQKEIGQREFKLDGTLLIHTCSKRIFDFLQ